MERVPWCFYPEDYGYIVTTATNTSSGMTVDISQNKKYRNIGRPGSPDIDKLRVEIRYHSRDMLQFKVFICFVLIVVHACVYHFSSFTVTVFIQFNASIHAKIKVTHQHPFPVQIWDPATDRYEVPVPLTVPATPETDESKRLYKVLITNNPFGIQVIRKSTEKVM